MLNSPWQRRIDSALRVKNEWEQKFRCSLLENYYEGFHWKNKFEKTQSNYNPYTINLFHSSIKIKLANYFFQCPKYNLTARPGTASWNQDFAAQSTGIKQDVLNTIVSNPNTGFVNTIKLATLDSFFRFGIIEFGWAADWRNPQKTNIELKSWENDDYRDEDKDKVIEDNPVPVNERFFVKRIPAQDFIVSVSTSHELVDHEWCGYHEYIYTSQLKKTKCIKWPVEANSSWVSSDLAGSFTTNSGIEDADVRQMVREGSVSKVWHIFDNVAHERKLFLDGYFDDPLWIGPMETLPLIDQRWDLRTRGFYPIPPCFQWIGPQDEINESREQTRSYRRRFTRKFQAVQGSVEPEELEKFTSGPDGDVINVLTANAITGINSPDMGQTERDALLVAKDDFNIVSGTSAEARGQQDRGTATQAKLMDMRSRIRESADQLEYSVFLSKIGRGLLVCAQENLSVGMWIKYTENPEEQPFTDMKVSGPLYKYITSQDLSDGYDFDIDVTIENATPAAMQEDLQAYQAFIGMLAAYPMLAMSPKLIRETAYRCNYRNESIIAQMQQVAVASLAAKAQAAEQQSQMAAATSGVNPQNTASATNSQMQVPTGGQVSQQINQQLGIQ